MCIVEFGNANLFPAAPPHKRTVPILAAMPTHIVDTSGLINCMVSYIASPALITPPGELMYRFISLSGSSLSRKSS